MQAQHLAPAVRAWAPRVLLALAGALATACSGAHEPAGRSHEATRRLGSIRPTANVPALVGYTIEGLQQRLGAPHELTGVLTDTACLANLAPHAADSLLLFRTGGLLLIASYNIHSRRVNDLFLLGHHEDSLMQRAALRADAPNYLVLPTFQREHPGQLLGLRVVPAQR